MSDTLKFCRPEEVGVHPSWVEDYANTVNRQRKMYSSISRYSCIAAKEGYMVLSMGERDCLLFSLEK